jgi:hypothetical protein
MGLPEFYWVTLGMEGREGRTGGDAKTFHVEVLKEEKAPRRKKKEGGAGGGNGGKAAAGLAVAAASLGYGPQLCFCFISIAMPLIKYIFACTI